MLILAALIKPQFGFLRGATFMFTWFGAIFSMLFIPGLVLIELGILVEVGLLKIAIDIRTMQWHRVAFLASACWLLSTAVMRASSGPNP